MPGTHRVLKFGAGIAAACALLQAAAIAAPEPMTLVATIAPPEVSSVSKNLPSPLCEVRILEFTDLRNEPAIIGVHGRKAVLAPQDGALWRRNMLAQLRFWGVLAVEQSAQEVSGPLAARIFIEKLWISHVFGDIAAGALIRVDQIGPSGQIEQTRFRGARQKITYFSAGEGKIQRGLDSALNLALEGVANHLRARCEAKNPA